ETAVTEDCRSIALFIKFSKNDDLIKEEISVYANSQNIKILYVNTFVDTLNRSVYFNNSVFRKVDTDLLKGLECVTSIDIYTGQLVLCFMHKNKSISNPLIKYLKKNPSKAIKMSFVYPTPTLVNINKELTDFVSKLKEILQPLSLILERKIDNIVYKIYITCNQYNEIDINRKKKTNLEIYDEIEDVIMSIYQLNKVMKNVKSKLILFMEIAKKILDLTTFEQVYSQELKLCISELSKIYILLIENIQEFLKELVENELKFVDIPIFFKNKIVKLINIEIDSHKTKNRYFLRETLNNFERKIAEASEYLTLETFTFNISEKDILEEVKEVEYNANQLKLLPPFTFDLIIRKILPLFQTKNCFFFPLVTILFSSVSLLVYYFFCWLRNILLC
ncbi:hypothetical protein CDIK_2661, partial [Cucumispora dikerogammari]